MTKTKKILFLDTETGGINPKEASILSIGCVVWENGAILDSQEIFIKHDVFKITPSAIAANQIDLVEFVKKAVLPEVAVNQLLLFLNRNFPDFDGNIIVGGHNTNFDINFLREFLLSQNIKFDSYFSHRFIDTASVLKFLYYAGKLPQDISSSDAAFNYFNIEIEKRHSALGDATGTANLFTKLIELIN